MGTAGLRAAVAEGCQRGGQGVCGEGGAAVGGVGAAVVVDLETEGFEEGVVVGELGPGLGACGAARELDPVARTPNLRWNPGHQEGCLPAPHPPEGPPKLEG
jgi:hypothetical protein